MKWQEETLFEVRQCGGGTVACVLEPSLVQESLHTLGSLG